MKKILAMLLCILSACATNKEIKKTYYENGNIKEETLYIEDKDVWNKSYYETGELFFYRDDNIGREYYTSGQVAEETPLKDGKKHGTKKIYKPNGKLKEEIYYEEGTKIWQKEYDEDGAKITEREYENGNLMSEKSYKDGNSIEKYYYDNGNLQQENENKGDIRISTKVYKKDGSFEHEFIRIDDVTEFHKSVVENGTIVGLLNKYYNKDKKVLKHSAFYLGDRLFDTEEYDENGILTLKIFYTNNGEEKSSAKYYYPNGKLQKEIHYEKAIKIWEKEYDENGNLISKDDK